MVINTREFRRKHFSGTRANRNPFPLGSNRLTTARRNPVGRGRADGRRGRRRAAGRRGRAVVVGRRVAVVLGRSRAVVIDRGRTVITSTTAGKRPVSRSRAVGRRGRRRSTGRRRGRRAVVVGRRMTVVVGRSRAVVVGRSRAAVTITTARRLISRSRAIVRGRAVGGRGGRRRAGGRQGRAATINRTDFIILSLNHQ